MAAGSVRTFNISSSACGIPASAAAYSLNVTVLPREPLGWLTLWPSGQNQPLVSTLNSPNGQVLANAAIVPAGIHGSVNVFVTNNQDVILDINGYFALQTSSTGDSTYLGIGALKSNQGPSNTAMGFEALQANTTGSGNVAVGANT